MDEALNQLHGGRFICKEEEAKPQSLSSILVNQKSLSTRERESQYANLDSK